MQWLLIIPTFGLSGNETISGVAQAGDGMAVRATPRIAEVLQCQYGEEDNSSVKWSTRQIDLPT
jgi:hypothetical protein